MADNTSKGVFINNIEYKINLFADNAGFFFYNLVRAATFLLVQLSFFSEKNSWIKGQLQQIWFRVNLHSSLSCFSPLFPGIPEVDFQNFRLPESWAGAPTEVWPLQSLTNYSLLALLIYAKGLASLAGLWTHISQCPSFHFKVRASY